MTVPIGPEGRPEIDYACLGKAWSLKRHGAGTQNTVPHQDATPVVIRGEVLPAYVDWAYADPLFFGLHFPMGKNAPMHVLHSNEVTSQLDLIHKPIQQHIIQIITTAHPGQDPELISGTTWTFMSGLALKIHQGLPKSALQKEIKLFIESLINFIKKD